MDTMWERLDKGGKGLDTLNLGLDKREKEWIQWTKGWIKEKKSGYNDVRVW